MRTKNILSNTIIFIAGAAIGSVVTWRLVKTKYEQIANEEIESMREHYNNKKKSSAEINESEEPTDEDRYGDIVKNSNYETYSDEIEEDEEMEKPYVIPPEEFGDCDYPTLSLTYYEGDGVLANDRDEIILNIDELVGEDFATHFGEYEEDSVFVRNDGMGVDYEILKDYGSHSELS